MPKTLILTDGESRAAAERRLTRVVRPFKEQPPADCESIEFAVNGKIERFRTKDSTWHPCLHWLKSPFGPTGGVLAAREKWGCPVADHPRCWGGRKPFFGDKIVYDADPADSWQWRRGGASMGGFCWRSASTMPAWASRFSLRIVAQRACQVKELTEEDAISLGSQTPCCYLPKSCRQGCLSELTQLSRMWNARYAKRPALAWNLDPFVAVAEVEIEIKERKP